MIEQSEIDKNFDPAKWSNITRLKGTESQEELIAKINDAVDHINYLVRFLIGAPE